MYRITLLTVGKKKRGPLKDLADQYVKWSSPSVRWEIKEVSEVRELPQNESLIILLDEAGQTFDSKTFANKLDAWAEGGAKPLTFVIGGAFGFSDAIKKKADIRLSLSPLTFPHEFARVILLEQIYRAMTILKGKRYHY